jgi:hypothetical protein
MSSLQVANFVILNAVGALLMVVTGTQKRLLRWKAIRRCPVCGRHGRHDPGCSCRRLAP